MSTVMNDASLGRTFGASVHEKKTRASTAIGTRASEPVEQFHDAKLHDAVLHEDGEHHLGTARILRRETVYAVGEQVRLSEYGNAARNCCRWEPLEKKTKKIIVAVGNTELTN